jgi:hypothetical protein
MDGIEKRRCADLIKVSVIENVGGLSAELNIHLLTDFRVLEQGYVPAPGSGTKY